jgi:hypothetical protein
MANEALGQAKKIKNDEFYTLYEYIQKEMNAYLEYNPNVFKGKTVLLPCDDPEWSNFTKYFAQNFDTLGLKKLISTSYATESKNQHLENYQFSIYDFITDFERNNSKFDEKLSASKGKIFTLEHGVNDTRNIDIDDLEWSYLNGDGDFHSDEVTKLRDEADIIVTNPPFSLFRDFISWIFEGKDKKCLIIGNQNNVTYPDVFKHIMNNELWIGATCNSEDMVFKVPRGTDIAPKDKEKAEKLGYIGDYTRMGNICWYTNIEHGRRHETLDLMTMEDNKKYSKFKEVKQYWYMEYINYPAIEVKYTTAIPKDYDGVMGVSPTFLSKYNPEQFEIIGMDGGDMGVSYGISSNLTQEECNKLFKEHKGFRKGKLCYRDEEGKLQVCYRRILIKRRGK